MKDDLRNVDTLVTVSGGMECATMTKSKENKERYQEYRRTTNNPLIYVEWLKRYER